MSMGGANHPTSCHICHGTGWQPTVTPCTNHWIDDDPTPDELISLNEYLHRHPEDAPSFTRYPTTRDKL